MRIIRTKEDTYNVSLSQVVEVNAKGIKRVKRPHEEKGRDGTYNFRTGGISFSDQI